MSGILKKVQKRDGTVVDFDQEKLRKVVSRTIVATRGTVNGDVDKVVTAVSNNIKWETSDGVQYIGVEAIQDEVERQLLSLGFVEEARAFINFRKEHELSRVSTDPSKELRSLSKESSTYFEGNPLGEFVYLRTYAKWIEEEGRRETWIETVDRYVDFMKENLGDKLSPSEYKELKMAILNQEVMPSMRLLQFAGKAIRKCNAASFNCTFIAPSKIEDFGEVLYLLACGCGVGFSVEEECIQELPIVKRQSGSVLKDFVVPDSREGWADALVKGMRVWYKGKDISFDYSKVRPAGARLKTFGGKASGPAPLKSLLDFTREKILSRQGKRLRNIDAHDILCKVGEAIVSGGVRRSAMISLSDIDDIEMRKAKSGTFYTTEPQRSLSNNSTAYVEKPSSSEFLREWSALVGSGSGERGIFNRGALLGQTPNRRKKKWEEMGHIVDNRLETLTGTNPCGEIILLPKQQCNLSEVVARSSDTKDDLMRKIRLAAILGTYQSTLTKYSYLSEEWTKNMEEERLLGVSITGQWDCKASRNAENLRDLKNEAVRVNKRYAERFGINQSTAVTAVKPSGTVSQTVDCSSGMHQRYAPYYIRRIRISSTDSLFKMLKDQGVPYHPEIGQTEVGANTYVLDFPVKAPKGSVFTKDVSALKQLEHWRVVKENYTEHNPSVTVSVGDDEWIEVADWVYKNWDIVGGLSFLPRSDHVYMLAPYEEITKEKYEELVNRFKNVDYSKLVTYELKDETEMKRELACTGNGTCELN